MRLLQQDAEVAAVAQVIELAIAPVFLLTAVGTLLGVLTNRFARVVDRARVLEGRLPPEAGVDHALRGELATLALRARLIQRAILLCTLTGIFVCAVIVALFVGAFLHVDSSGAVALFFIAAMLAFLGGLLQFLREVFVATQSLRIGRG